VRRAIARASGRRVAIAARGRSGWREGVGTWRDSGAMFRDVLKMRLAVRK
jgi:hypothetical protein